MRFTLISPLFPPDIACSARYVKILLTKLSNTTSGLTAIMYANIPEVLPDVHFVVIPKRQNVLSRLMQMLRTIRSHKQTTDVYILCNGPSTELPFWLSQLFSSHPFIFIYNDAAALARTHHSWWRNYIHASLCARAKAVVDIGATIAEYCPPEIHPLLPYPETAQSKFETLWEKHLTEITDHLYVT